MLAFEHDFISFLLSSEAVTRRCSVKGVLRNFKKFTGKHLCYSLFKKETWYRFFPVNYANFLRTPFLTEHLRWLLLSVTPLSGICYYLCLEMWQHCLEKMMSRNLVVPPTSFIA